MNVTRSTSQVVTFVSLFAAFAIILMCGQPAKASIRGVSSQPSFGSAAFHAGYLPAKTDLAKLRQQAEDARRALERGTKKWEEGRKKLDRVQKRLMRTEKKLASAERRLERLRGPVAAIANATYQSPTASSAVVLVAAERPQSALRAAADLEKLSATRSALIDAAAREQARLTRLTNAANDLRKDATAEADRLARLMKQLQREAAAATERLTRALRELGERAARGGRIPVSCDPALTRKAARYPNGLIPQWALCALPQRGHLLRPDAAIAFSRMNAAYAARFREPLCVTSSYRPLSAQQRVYAERPGMAAVPGSSLHGLGLAIDLCGGVQQYGSQRYNWMVANSGRFGWYHPAWARGSQFEPWHWEFDA